MSDATSSIELLQKQLHDMLTKEAAKIVKAAEASGPMDIDLSSVATTAGTSAATTGTMAPPSSTPVRTKSQAPVKSSKKDKGKAKGKSPTQVQPAMSTPAEGKVTGITTGTGKSRAPKKATLDARSTSSSEQDADAPSAMKTKKPPRPATPAAKNPRSATPVTKRRTGPDVADSTASDSTSSSAEVGATSEASTASSAKKRARSGTATMTNPQPPPRESPGRKRARLATAMLIINPKPCSRCVSATELCTISTANVRSLKCTICERDDVECIFPASSPPANAPAQVDISPLQASLQALAEMVGLVGYALVPQLRGHPLFATVQPHFTRLAQEIAAQAGPASVPTQASSSQSSQSAIGSQTPSAVPRAERSVSSTSRTASQISAAAEEEEESSEESSSEDEDGTQMEQDET